MFSPADQALDLTSRITTSRLLKSPLDEGTWALLEPAGRQNHAPQPVGLIRIDLLVSGWLVDKKGQLAWIYLSQLRRGKNRWTRPRLISRDETRSEQNPPLCHGRRAAALNTLLSELGILKIGWQNGNTTFSMQWTAA